MKDGEAEDRFAEVRLSLATHNFEVTLKRLMDYCFRTAIETGRESFEGFQRMDDFVRTYYADEPRRMAEWEEIAQKYEFADDEIEE